jgi:ATP dependent DNA ligase domain
MASRPRPSILPPIPGAVPGSPPASQAPQLCSLVRKAPQGPAWFTEVKFDGYRFLAWKAADGVRLVTRNGHDWADRLPAVARSIGSLSAAEIVVDGELVAVRPDGVTSFPDLQDALSAGADHKLIFYAFDLSPSARCQPRVVADLATSGDASVARTRSGFRSAAHSGVRDACIGRTCQVGAGIALACKGRLFASICDRNA